MGQIDGIRSYEGLRKRAATFHIGNSAILVATLADIIRSKRAAGRPAALKSESDRALTDLIRYRLSLPPEKRLNVLRKKLAVRATCL